MSNDDETIVNEATPTFPLDSCAKRSWTHDHILCLRAEFEDRARQALAGVSVGIYPEVHDRMGALVSELVGNYATAMGMLGRIRPAANEASEAVTACAYCAAHVSGTIAERHAAMKRHDMVCESNPLVALMWQAEGVLREIHANDPLYGEAIKVRSRWFDLSEGVRLTERSRSGVEK